MEDKWGNLLIVLQQMLTIYQDILRLSQEKKQILIAAKSAELEKITKKEDALILQVATLEEMRGKLVGEIMGSHGIVGPSIDLAQLQKIARPDLVDALAVFSKEFKSIMAQIVPLNKLNTALIQQSLNFINYNMNILAQVAVGPTYAAKGHANEQAPQRKVFDAKV
jgi:flagellar biosynthesis/type III secretory pathway chaperone